MNNDAFNMSIRKFLKMVGVHSQREIESAVERAMVAGIFILYVSFFSIFLGGGLMLMKGFVLAIFAPVIPGILVASLVYDSWTDYREVKAKLRASSRSGVR